MSGYLSTNSPCYFVCHVERYLGDLTSIGPRSSNPHNGLSKCCISPSNNDKSKKPEEVESSTHVPSRFIEFEPCDGPDERAGSDENTGYPPLSDCATSIGVCRVAAWMVSSVSMVGVCWFMARSLSIVFLLRLPLGFPKLER